MLEDEAQEESKALASAIKPEFSGHDAPPASIVILPKPVTDPPRSAESPKVTSRSLYPALDSKEIAYEDKAITSKRKRTIASPEEEEVEVIQLLLTSL